MNDRMTSVTGIIYCATHFDGRKYYGKTIKTLAQRRACHIASSKIDKPKSHFHRALKLYGKNSFTWQIVESCPISELSEKERFWIRESKTFNPQFGFNETLGGEGCPATIETRKKISDAYKRKVRIFQFTKTGQFLNEFQSYKEASRWLQSQTGKNVNIAGVKDVKRSHGFVWSRTKQLNEQRLNEISKPKITLERNKKISSKLSGRQISKEWRKRISEGRKGIHLSEEQRQQRSKTIKRLWETKWKTRRKS